MPPAFTRGVAPVRTLVPGGARHPHPFHKKCEEWNCKHRKINYLTLSEIRTPPVPALAQGHPPHKCGGQGRVPHPPAHHCPNSSTNSNFPVCCFTAAKSRAFTLRFVIGARKDRKFGRIMAASRWRAGEKRGKSPEKKCKIFKNILSFSNPLWYN